jgi:hypothetical protein
MRCISITFNQSQSNHRANQCLCLPSRSVDLATLSTFSAPHFSSYDYPRFVTSESAFTLSAHFRRRFQISAHFAGSACRHRSTACHLGRLLCISNLIRFLILISFPLSFNRSVTVGCKPFAGSYRQHSSCLRPHVSASLALGRTTSSTLPPPPPPPSSPPSLPLITTLGSSSSALNPIGRSRRRQLFQQTTRITSVVGSAEATA